jgi:hypothetical protein
MNLLVVAPFGNVLIYLVCGTSPSPTTQSYANINFLVECE